MAGKIKILFVVEAMGGGVFTYIVDLANELVSTHDIYIAYAKRNQTPQNYKKYFNKAVHLIEVESFGRAINVVKDFKAFLEIREIARCIKPDVIHLHSSKAGVLGRLAFSGKKIPVFYTPHGYSFLMDNCSMLKRKFFRIVELICAKRSCTTISCSVGEHKESLKLTKRAVYVDNGINMEALREIIKKIKGMSHPFTVFTLGRICYQKNPELFNQIAEAMPEVRFVWIGDGGMRDELLSSNIEITGWKNREQAIGYAMEADVFILTSRWEGLPISLLEAMYMKKLCIVSNVPGNRDVIRNGENGFICQTAEDFIEAIRTAGSEACQILKENAYQDILKLYNTKVMAEKYSRIYRKTV